MTRTIITGGDVLVGDPRQKNLARADLLIEDGRITAIGPTVETRGDEEVIDAGSCWVVPGFVDTHHHLWQSTMRALTGDFTLDEYFSCIRRGFSTAHRPQDIYAGTYGGAISQLDSGTTCTVDFSHCLITPEHADAAVAGIRDAAIRSVWCYGLYAPPVDEPTFRTWEDRFADARRVRSTHFPDDGGLVRFGVAPNEMVRVPLEQTFREYRVGQELDALIHPHTNTRWRPGVPSDIRLLAAEGVLGPKQLHSHCTTCTIEDLAIIADAGSAVSATPETELAMGLGFTVLTGADAAGIPTGIGTDIQSNNSADLFTAMRLGLQSERGRLQQELVEREGTSALERVALRTEDVLHMATLGGARGLGLGDVCGSLEVGKAADILVINTATPRLQPTLDPVAALVLHATIADIDTVLVGGTVRKRHGRLVDGVADRAVTLLREAAIHVAAGASA